MEAVKEDRRPEAAGPVRLADPQDASDRSAAAKSARLVKRLPAFASLLHHDEARRATEVVEAVLAHGLRCALTGGLPIDAQLRARGRLVEPRDLNDIDFVVESFVSIPESAERSQSRCGRCSEYL